MNSNVAKIARKPSASSARRGGTTPLGVELVQIKHNVQVDFIEDAVDGSGLRKTKPHPVTIYVLATGGEAGILPDMGPMRGKSFLLQSGEGSGKSHQD